MQRSAERRSDGLRTALAENQRELATVLAELRAFRLQGEWAEDPPTDLILLGARLERECEELEQALRETRAGVAGGA